LGAGTALFFIVKMIKLRRLLKAFSNVGKMLLSYNYPFICMCHLTGLVATHPTSQERIYEEDLRYGTEKA
jgi:hypothetical protein